MGPEASASAAKPKHVTAAEALQLAEEEGLTLVRSSVSQTGFKGVYRLQNYTSRFEVKISKDGVFKHIGFTASAEEGALIYARHLGLEASAEEAAKPADSEERKRKREEDKRDASVAKEASRALAKQQKQATEKAQRDLARREREASRREAEERRRQAAAKQHQLLKESQQRLFRETVERQRAREAAESDGRTAQGTASRTPNVPLPTDGPIDDVITAVLAGQHCPYTCLGVPVHATREVCRKSYLQLALRLHPDKCPDPRAKDAFAAAERAFRAVSLIGERGY